MKVTNPSFYYQFLELGCFPTNSSVMIHAKCGGQELIQGIQSLLEKVGSGCQRASLSLQPQTCGDEHRRSLVQMPAPLPPAE